MQSKKLSFIEVLTNTLIGYGIAVVGQILIFPMFGLKVSLADNLWIGLLFTVVSVFRGYVIRRIFNKGESK